MFKNFRFPKGPLFVGFSNFSLDYHNPFSPRTAEISR